MHSEPLLGDQYMAPLKAWVKFKRRACAWHDILQADKGTVDGHPRLLLGTHSLSGSLAVPWQSRQSQPRYFIVVLVRSWYQVEAS
jgi:hypothetical protein